MKKLSNQDRYDSVDDGTLKKQQQKIVEMLCNIWSTCECEF